MDCLKKLDAISNKISSNLSRCKIAYNIKSYWLLMSVSSGMVQGISVVTTTWNERENIEELILRVKVNASRYSA